MSQTLVVELTPTLEKRLDRIEDMLTVLLDRREGQKGGLMTKKEMCETYSISPSTVDRGVYDGTIEKVMVSPRSPRYRMKERK